MWARFRSSKEYTDWVEYNKTQNKAITEYIRAKRNFETKLTANIRKDPKSFYSYVRFNSKCNDRVGPLKDVNEDIVTDDLGMCNILNNFSTSVFTCENLTDVLPEDKQRYFGSSDGMLNDIK